jgi:hypothetical protein
LKVPTFHKFGITKAQILKSDSRDKKISDILTHHLTIGIGIVFGLVLYILYFDKVRPDTFLQIIMQVTLFASMGIICVGIPAVLFKLAEIFYFKQVKAKTVEFKTIAKYNEQRETFDFWKLRKDYSFWNILDGLSFEKEVMNVHMYLDYTDRPELSKEEFPDDRILEHNGKLFYFSFYTMSAEFKETETIDDLLMKSAGSVCEKVYLFSQKGFNKRVIDYVKDKPIILFDINGIIKVVRTIKDKGGNA